MNIVNKKEKMLEKLYHLVQEINDVQRILNEEKKQYLKNYQTYVELIITRLQNDTLPSSKGGLIGTMRGISEYDDLANIDSLYDAAYEVDLFYSEECQEW